VQTAQPDLHHLKDRARRDDGDAEMTLKQDQRREPAHNVDKSTREVRDDSAAQKDVQQQGPAHTHQKDAQQQGPVENGRAKGRRGGIMDRLGQRAGDGIQRGIGAELAGAEEPGEAGVAARLKAARERVLKKSQRAEDAVDAEEYAEAEEDAEDMQSGPVTKRRKRKNKGIENITASGKAGKHGKKRSKPVEKPSASRNKIGKGSVKDADATSKRGRDAGVNTPAPKRRLAVGALGGIAAWVLSGHKGQVDKFRQ